MATKVQMQAKSSANGALYSWLAVAPDWVASGYGGPGSPLDIALTGGGLDNSAVADDGVDVVAIAASGAYAVSAGGAWAVTTRKVAVSTGGATAVAVSGAWAVTR